jgi:branched-chain amino acid transport system permease protein
MTTFVQYLIDGVANGCLFALAAIGVGILFGVMRLANFAHGELIMLGAYALIVVGGLPWWLAWILSLALVGVVALVTERVAFRSLRGREMSTLLIASFAVSITLQNATVIAFGIRPRAVPMPEFVNRSLAVAGLRVPVVSVLTVGLSVAALLALVAFFKRTSLGLQMRAAAEDFRMAQLLGTRANRIVAASFAISGALAAIVGIMLVSRSGTVVPSMGLTPVLFAFVAVTIGGLGNLVGSAVGGFLLGALTIAMQAILPVSMVSYRDAFIFLACIALLIFRPEGILPSIAIEERV